MSIIIMDKTTMITAISHIVLTSFDWCGIILVIPENAGIQVLIQNLDSASSAE